MSQERVPNVNHDQLKNHIKVSGRANKSLFIWGTFGVGKSVSVKETAKEMAKEKGRKFIEFNGSTDEEKRKVMENPEDYHLFVDIRLAELKPENIKGIPNLQSDYEATEWEPPVWAKMLCLDGISGTAFLDEANLASQSVQSAAYKIILDRQVGTHKLSDKVNVVAAGNRAGKDRANVYDMSAPLRNRFLHVQLQIPSAGKDGSWIDWATDNGIHDYVIGFLGSPVGQEHLYEFGENNEDEQTIPTPRMWEFTSDLLKAESRELTPKRVRELSATAVGQGVANDFADFVKNQQSYDFEKLLDKPETVTDLKSENIGIKRSVMTGLASEWNKDPSEHQEAIMKISYEMKSEYGALLISQIKSYNEKKFKQLMYDDDIDQEVIEKVVNKYHEIIEGIDE